MADVITDDLQRKRTFFIKSECNEIALPVHDAGQGTGSYWLVALPESVTKELKRRSGVLKSFRRRNGSRGYSLHTVEPGRLVQPHCQMCGAHAACPHDVAGKKMQPMPWAAYESLPHCEYCGVRLASKDTCRGCGAREYGMLAPPATQERPHCVVRETRKHLHGKEFSYSYGLDRTPIAQRVSVIDSVSETEKRSKEATDDSVDVTEYQRLDAMSGLSFKKKSDEEVLDIVLRALKRRTSNKLMLLEQVVEISGEPRPAVARVLPRIAERNETGLWKLK